jgi:hypothetical protein
VDIDAPTFGYNHAPGIDVWRNAMSDAERTRPNRKTRAAEVEDEKVTAQADDLPTHDEEAAAERGRVEDPEAADAYKEAIERGARQQGEGRVP